MRNQTLPVDNEVIQALRATVRRYVHERLVCLETQVSQNDRVPDEIWPELAEMGLFGMAIPQEYGGLGLRLAWEIILNYELAWTSPAFRAPIGSSNGIGSQGIVIDGTEAQKLAWLPRIATGQIVAALALTEPEAGSDAGSLRTRALLEGDNYILNGTKRYISNAPYAGLFTVMARTNPSIAGSAGISAFLVDANSPGIFIAAPDKKMGQQGALTADVVFDNVAVPRGNLLGGSEGRGFKTAMKVLDRGRLVMAAVACGMIARLVHEMVSYATTRRQFGKPISEFQLIQAMIADSQTEGNAAWCMTQDAARRYDAGELVSLEAAACKYFATEAAGRIADRAVQVLGGAGYMTAHAVERIYRDVRLLRIYEGTSQIMQLVIARETLRRHSIGAIDLISTD
jgi:acyl-CoA dehydrogenase